ncbi:MAG: DNA polymerase III subunit gamma/tau [Nitratireductor sp.]
MTELSQAAGSTPYRVLARKYRPQNFDDLIGQAPMVRTLTNAFQTGRIAQAYMLTGVRGIGKTTTARILARALNYRKAGVEGPTIDVREEGEDCRAIMEGRHVDVIEMDAASHTGIDDIRDIIESVQYAPAVARYKVYIIDEVHMLSRNAFNGLLKTLEEPPAHLKFIFATTEIRKVPVTVLSRCQRFDLRRIDAGLLSQHLSRIASAEGIAIGDDALAMISRAAEGSVRDALSILDQAIAHSSGAVAASEVRVMLGLSDRARVIDLFEMVMKGDIGAALAEMRDQYDLGADPHVVMSDLGDFIHYVTRLKYVPNAADDAALSEAERRRGAEFAASLSVRVLARAWQILIKGLTEIQSSERPLAAADMVLVRLTHAANLPGPEELARMPPGDEAASAPGRPQASPRSNVGPGTSSGAPVSAISGSTSQPQQMRGSTMQARMSEPKPSVPTPQPEPAVDALVLNSFEELVMLAEDKRDIRIRTLLRRNARLVSFADGKIELNLTENTPHNFIPDLSNRLQEWTGRRWMVITSREGGQPTIEETEQAEVRGRTEDALANPAVDAILQHFPGAKVIDVKIREGRDVFADPDSGTADIENDHGMDEFFD